MHITEVSEQKIWDEFIVSNGSQFLQSWKWAEFQKKIGRKIWRLAIKDSDNIVGQALLIKYRLPLWKSYFYCPRGPIFKSNSEQKVIDMLIKNMKILAKKENAIFLRIEQLKKINDIDSEIIKVNDVQPSQTTILNINLSEREILNNMRAKTRYNIGLAERRGVICYKAEKDSRDVDVFLDLIHQTSEREQFKPHNNKYYRALLDLDERFINLYLAEYKNKVLAAHIVVNFNDTVTYIHGASTREYNNVMAPHILHWQIIKDAMKNGYKFYDFWGIDKKRWSGLTRFKTGFAGKTVTYLGTFDIPLNNLWYYLYKFGTSCRSYLQCNLKS